VSDIVFVLFMVIVAVAGYFYRLRVVAGEKAPGPLAATDLCITDASGNVRVRLFAHDGGQAGLVVTDVNGNQRVLVFVSPSGVPSMVFADEVGVSRIAVGVAEDTVPAIEIGGPGDHVRCAVCVESGKPVLRFYDGNMVLLSSFAMDVSGRAYRMDPAPSGKTMPVQKSKVVH